MTDRRPRPRATRPPWPIASAALGGALWFAAPWAPTRAAPPFAGVEHVFLLAPLVAVPLALALVAGLLVPEDRAAVKRAAADPYGLATRGQPLAAALLVASFFFERGRVAGALAAPWAFVALLVAIGGSKAVLRAHALGASRASLLAGHVFLPIGAAWLVLSRLDIRPAALPPPVVLLAAVHFHFSGFLLQMLIAATTRARAQRFIAPTAIAAIALIAAGNLLAAPGLKLAGVGAMVLSTVALAAVSLRVAQSAPTTSSKVLLRISATSIAAAMVIAGVYGVSELTGGGWIGIPEMIATHGLLNALGFTICGLAGHLCARSVAGLTLNERASGSAA